MQQQYTHSFAWYLEFLTNCFDLVKHKNVLNLFCYFTFSLFVPKIVTFITALAKQVFPDIKNILNLLKHSWTGSYFKIKEVNVTKMTPRMEASHGFVLENSSLSSNLSMGICKNFFE